MALEARWKKGFRYSGVQAVTAVAVLKRVEKAGGGMIQPDAVVAAAKPARSPLHALFTWEDTEAARKWRREEARRLLRHLVIVDSETGEERAPAFINVLVEAGEDTERSYMPVQAVAESEFLRGQAVLEALKGLEAWQKRYQHLEDLAEIFEVAKDVKARAASKAV